LCSVDEEGKAMHGFRISLTREKNNENGEGGYKIQSTRCLSFKEIDVKAEKEEKLTHKITQQRTHRGKP
jgi:hypothetical protein